MAVTQCTSLAMSIPTLIPQAPPPATVLGGLPAPSSPYIAMIAEPNQRSRRRWGGGSCIPSHHGQPA